MTFIALDVGNTRLKWAMYADHSVNSPLLAQGAVFLENIDRLADEDWKPLPAATRMLGCIVAGDALRRRVDEQLEQASGDTEQRLGRALWTVTTDSDANGQAL